MKASKRDSLRGVVQAAVKDSVWFSVIRLELAVGTVSSPAPFLWLFLVSAEMLPYLCPSRTSLLDRKKRRGPALLKVVRDR